MLNKKSIYIGIIFLLASTGYTQTTQWRLLWEPNTENDMYYYKIFRDTHSSPTTPIDTTLHPHTEFIDTNIQPGVRYYYRLKAVDSTNLESNYSAEVSAAIPNITNMADQFANQGQNITINLNNYVSDPDNNDSQIQWTYQGNSTLSISINSSNIATVSAPSSNWYGSEMVTFTATDPDGFFDTGATTLVINAIPVVSSISGQTINQGGSFTTINLDNFVTDADNSNSQLSWATTGNSNLNVSINSNRIATISTPSPNWYGQETITFTATDPYGASDAVSATFKVNGQPQITRSSPMDQKIGVGQSFSTFDLDNYVSDPDNPDNELSWTYSGNSFVQIAINSNHVVTVTPQSSETIGADTVLFRVQDPGGLNDQINVIFSIVSMGTPIVNKIPDQYINQGNSFSIIQLDNFVSDPESPDEDISWSYSGTSHLSVSINSNRAATVTSPDPEWAGIDTITFTATDPEENSDNCNVIFTVNGAPVLSAIPNQQINSGESFSNIGLDNYVSDPNDSKSALTWTYKGNQHIEVAINTQHIASFTLSNENWAGSESITFMVTDPGILKDSISVEMSILSLSSPSISNIPNQLIDLTDSFTDIDLNTIVTDSDTDPADINWSYSGNSNLVVEITTQNIARIARPDINWMGTEIITFTAADPEGHFDTEDVSFTVDASPKISKINSQIIEAGDEFSPVNLDDFVNDLNNNDDELTWSVSGNSSLIVKLDVNRIVTIQTPSMDWTGSESLFYTVTDPYGLTSTDTAIYTVVPQGTDITLNILSINNQTISQGGQFKAINLNDHVDCDESLKSQLTWTLTGNTNLHVDISNDRIATISVLDPSWFGEETIHFMATTPNGISAETDAIFKVKQNIFSVLDFHLMGSGTIVEVRWFTEIPVQSRILYGLTTLNESSESNLKYETEHVLVISNLNPNSVYSFQAAGFDTSGEEFLSAIQTFETSSESAVNVFPNPYTAGKYPENDVVNFTNLPDGASLQIYNLLGEPVFSQKNINHIYRWNTTNDHDDNVQAGLYLYVIKGADNKKLTSGKIVIIR